MKVPFTYPENTPMTTSDAFGAREIPNVHEIRANLTPEQRGNEHAGWDHVAKAVGMKQADAFHLGYYLEDFTLQDATPENVAALRADGLRWERIAVRTGLAKDGKLGTTKVRALYSEGTGFIPETSRAKDGRGFAETLEGPKKPTPAAKKKLTAIRSTRKAGVRGDRKVLAVATESLKKAKAPKAPAAPKEVAE